MSILGQRLDNTGFGKKRWFRWRPTLSLLQHHDFQVDEVILLHQGDEKKLLDLTVNDIKQSCLNIDVTSHQLNIEDPWDFEQVYSELHDFAKSHSFDVEKNNYYFHITTGTHVAQICIYLLNDVKF